MIAVDTSVLLWAANRWAPEHARASRVLESLAHGDTAWAIGWPAAHAFLATVTHPHAVARPVRGEEAWGFIRALGRSPSVQFLGPGADHARVADQVLAMLPAGPLPDGFELAVVLREHGVRELLSGDRGMRVFPFLEIRDPVHEPGWTVAQPPTRRYRVLSPR